MDSQTSLNGREWTDRPSENKRPISTRLVSRSAWLKRRDPGTRPLSGLLEAELVRNRQFFTAFGATAVDDRASGFGFHAAAKAVLVAAFAAGRLKSALHRIRTVNRLINRV